MNRWEMKEEEVREVSEEVKRCGDNRERRGGKVRERTDTLYCVSQLKFHQQ